MKGGGMRAGAIEDQITFLYCSDIRETARFYEKILGFELVVDQGNCRIVRAAQEGGGYLGYCERLEEKRNSGGILITLVTQDVDGWYAHLVAMGVRVSDPPANNSEYGIYHFFFKDPDGYTLEIQSFLDPDWKAVVEGG